MSVSIRTFTDHDGKKWTAERIGRTSGIVGPGGSSGASFPEPADIIRFVCTSDRDEPERETTMGAGLMDKSSDEDLISRLSTARKLRR